jgi:hypothetical protein
MAKRHTVLDDGNKGDPLCQNGSIDVVRQCDFGANGGGVASHQVTDDLVIKRGPRQVRLIT